MGTAFPEFFSALAADFHPSEVRSKPGRGRDVFYYVTARTVMNRLDEVAGPENWWAKYLPGEHGVLCQLTIRLPDGREITKENLGAKAGMQDAGDDDKSGVSDALKRAAVEWGIARYLYRDGVPDYAGVPAPVEANGHAAEPAAGRTERAEAIDFRKVFAILVSDLHARADEHYRKDVFELKGTQPEAPFIHVNPLFFHVHKWCIEGGFLPGQEGKKASVERSREEMNALWKQAPEGIKRGIRNELIRYIAAHLEIAKAKLREAAPQPASA